MITMQSYCKSWIPMIYGISATHIRGPKLFNGMAENCRMDGRGQDMVPRPFGSWMKYTGHCRAIPRRVVDMPHHSRNLERDLRCLLDQMESA